MRPISIQLYTVRTLTENGAHVGVLQQIADLGYKGVEGSGYGLKDKEFRKLVEDMGMVVSSTWGPPPAPENVQQYIDSAGDLGTQYVVSGYWIPQFETVESIDELAEGLNKALPLLDAAGLKFCLHNHWMEFETIDGRLKIDYLIERVPNIQLELDLYWCSNFGANKPEEMVAKYRDRIGLLHVKDGPQERDKPMTAVGSGTVDIKTSIARIDEAETAWYVVELDEFDGNMMDAVAGSYKYLVGEGLASGNKAV